MKVHFILSLLAICVGALIIFAIYLEFIAKDFTPKTDISLKNVDIDIQKILYYASLAPSSHNAQMYKVRINPVKRLITLSLDNKRILSVVDSDLREAFISLGCYAKALEDAFKAFNYQTKTDILDDKKQLVISYSKENEGEINHDILNSLKLRHTDKQIFLDKPIEDSSISALSGKYQNLLIIKKEDPLFESIKNLIIDASKRQAFDKQAANELASYMRFSDEEANQKQDGLNAEQLGLRGIKKFFYYSFLNKEKVCTDSFSKQTVKIITNLVNSAPAFILINNDKDTFESRVKTGMQLVDLWLFLNNNNIQVQPLSAAIEYKDSAQILNNSTFAFQKLS